MKRASLPDSVRLAVGVFVTLMVVLRLVDLDARPMMHDESLFAYFSYLYSTTGHYTHQPILHGPGQILGVGWFFRLFGDSAGVARSFVACWSLVALGLGIYLWPRRFRWWLAPLLASSPILLYYSRFLHEEMLFSALVLMGVHGLLMARRPGPWALVWRILGPASLILLLAVKENALFVYASGATFLVARWAVARFWSGRASGLTPRPAGELGENGPPAVRCWLAELRGGVDAVKNLRTAEEKRHERRLRKTPLKVKQLLATLPRCKRPVPRGVHDDGNDGHTLGVAGLALGFALGLGLVLWIYGTTTADHGFSPLANMRASWDYWLGQHQEHRIEGSVHHYLPIILTYELPLVLFLALGLFIDALQRPRRLLWYSGSLATWATVWLVWSVLPDRGVIHTVTRFLHVRPDASSLALGLAIVPLLAWSILCLKERRVLSGWLGWWAACSLFQYSTAGEKVPWLAVHIVLPLYMVLGWLWAPLLLRLGPAFRKWSALAVVVAALLALRNDVYLVGSRAADPRERLVYNHTTVEFDRLCRSTVDTYERLATAVPLIDRRVVLAGDPT